ncbi:MAG: Asp23/Gls24 family envelope stress response protein [Oscillospiraceae bacterium]|nr:Asp23/Gls24 family envelope stress response protein [Oscillospiraceae bacterium]MDD4413655.1 Asp23/Gls24 family envelope stress response protein [Oscillospiraceae bacterium]
MNRKEYKSSEGSCIISEEVIASIASTAAMEVAGVAGMAQKPTDIRGLIGITAAKSVRVLNNESETILDVYININLGARIPDVAPAVQHNVKVAVQSMTGKPVNKVNVHIAGIVIDENKETPV